MLGPNNSFHFAGDTGYCHGFQQIGRKYGPFTAAAIPIGAYHPRYLILCALYVCVCVPIHVCVCVSISVFVFVNERERI